MVTEHTQAHPHLQNTKRTPFKITVMTTGFKSSPENISYISGDVLAPRITVSKERSFSNREGNTPKCFLTNYYIPIHSDRKTDKLNYITNSNYKTS